MKDERPKPSVTTPHGQNCMCLACRSGRVKANK